MTTFLLKLTLCWAFFALLYAWLLKHETFFRANRFYLLGTVVLGIILSALPVEQWPVPLSAEGMPIVVLPEFNVGIQQIEVRAEAWQRFDLLKWIYFTGCALMLLRLVLGFIKIIQMAIRGQSQQLPDGCLLVRTAETQVPFSFFKWVFVPNDPVYGLADPNYLRQDPNTHIAAQPASALQLMLAHESAHAQGWHSADVLFAELLCIIFWFHPIAHWYRKALRTVHEYLADAAASRQADRKQYGLLLIGQSQSGMPVVFANHFFQSPLKQRLIMLTKKASAPVRAAKFGLILPIALLFAILFRQAPAIAQAVDENHLSFVRELESKGWTLTDTIIAFDPVTKEESIKVVSNKVAPELDENGKLVYTYTEVQPQFPGGSEAMTKFLAEQLVYPELAYKNKVEGTVVVTFIVDETGTVIRPQGKIDKPGDAGESLVKEAVRVVQAMPKWTPAMHKGKAVRCSLCIPVNFKLPKTGTSSAEVQPEFPGGMDALFKFLSENIKYPETARAAKAEGMVIIKFQVKEDGSLAEVENLSKNKPLHPDLVTEAIRVVNSMPKWKPGIKDGKVVKMEYVLPMKFKLSDEK